MSRIYVKILRIVGIGSSSEKTSPFFNNAPLKTDSLLCRHLFDKFNLKLIIKLIIKIILRLQLMCNIEVMSQWLINSVLGPTVVTPKKKEGGGGGSN